jgi:hypothetical protein
LHANLISGTFVLCLLNTSAGTLFFPLFKGYRQELNYGCVRAS